MKLFSRNKWEVRRTIWPYRDGWGVYNPSTRTILDHGLAKERAQQICDEMNKPTKGNMSKPTTTEPSKASLNAAEALGNAGKLHRWPESQDKIMEAASLIDSSFAELIDQSKDMASLLAQMLVLASADGRLTNDSMLADAIREQLKKYRSSRVIR